MDFRPLTLTSGGDVAMQAAYRSGDPYLTFGKQAGWSLKMAPKSPTAPRVKLPSMEDDYEGKVRPSAERQACRRSETGAKVRKWMISWTKA